MKGKFLALFTSLLLVLQLVLPVGSALAAFNTSILPPSNLAAQVVNVDDVKLTWSPVYGATGYNVYNITEGQLLLVGKATTSATYTIADRTPGEYTYVVSTLSVEGESGPCAPVSVTVAAPEMTAPATFTHTLQNVNDIVLSWSASANAQSYNVYRLSEDGTKTLLANRTDRSYTITNAPEGEQTFAVSAVHATFGESPLSAVLKVTVTHPVLQAPATLASSLANVNDVVLSWSAVTYANGYKVYEVVNGERVLRSNVAQTTVTYTNVAAGEYSYEVIAYSDRFGEGPGKTVMVTVGEVTMLPPGEFGYTIKNLNDIVLTWTAAPNTTNYRIYQIVDGVKVLKSTITGTSITYLNMPGGDYEYVIHAYSDRFGESPEGSRVTFQLGTVTMEAPSNFTSTIVNGNDIVLTWSSTPNTTNYKVYQVVNGTKVLKSTLTGLTVTYSNAAAGDYTYVVHSNSTKYGESPEGSTATFTLAHPVMQPPADLSQTVTSATEFTLGWSASPYATSYKVYQVVNGQKVLKQTVTTGLKATFTGMAPGEYTYQVHSVSTRFGESQEGSKLTFTLTGETMQAPGNPTGTVTNINDITLKWTAAPYATNYKVYQIIDGQKVLKTTTPGFQATYTMQPAGDYTFVVHSLSNLLGESPAGAEIKVEVVYPPFDAPANLQHSIVNGNDIVLRWSPVNYATSYNIYQIFNGQKTLKNTITGTTQTYANLPAGDYSYEVYAVNSRMGEAPSGSLITVNLIHPVMEPPANATYSIANSNDIVLKWNSATYANTYKIYQIDNGQPSLLKTVTSTTLTFPAMQAGEYTYEIHSVSTRFGESPEGSLVSVKLEYQDILPPVNATYTIKNGNDIALTWTASANATSYKIYLVSNGQKVLKNTIAGLAVTYTNMAAGDYEYIIHSYSDRYGESSEGAAVAFALVHPNMAPPETLTQSVLNGGDIKLTWSAASYATSYKIYQIVNGEKVLKRTVTGLTTTFAKMSTGEYEFQVHAFSDRFGESAEGQLVKVTIEYQMETPQNVAYGISNGNDITLSWASVPYATSYRVYQLIDGAEVLQKTVTGTSVGLINQPAGDYSFAVHSYSDRFGESPEGGQLSLTLVHPVMQKPANLTKTITNFNDLTLRWAAATYATSYRVYQVVDGVKVLKKSGTALNAAFTLLPEGDYTYIVHSYSDRFGESPEGSEISFTLTYPDMISPASLTHAITNGNDFTLSWGTSTNATGYKLYRVVDGQKSLYASYTGTSALFTNMPAGEYRYVIHSYNTRLGESEQGTELAFNLVHPVMQAPGPLTHTVTNGNDFTLKWNTATYATNYRLYQIVDGQKVLKRTQTATTFSFTNQPEGKYEYVVHSYSNRFGESPEGAVLTFDLVWPTLQPPTPSGTVFNANNMTFTWTAKEWANEYRLYEVLPTGRQLLYKGTALTTQVFNLTEGTHTYEMTIYNTRFGESAPSDKFSKTIVFPIMEPPTATVKIVDDSSARLVWNFITYANGYNVYKLVDGQPVLLVKNLNNLSYTVTGLSKGNHDFYITSNSNSFGESKPGNTVTANFDAAPPVTTAQAPAGYVSGDATVALTATDDVSGVAATYYAVDGQAYSTGTSVIVTGEGTHTVSFYSVDKAGNKEQAKQIEVKIDGTAPKTAASYEAGWVQKVTVTLQAVDSASGVAKTYYSVNGADYVEGTTFTVEENGVNQISFYSVDAAGNQEQAQTVEVKVDQVKPVTEANAPTGWSQEAVQVTLTATDAHSGAAKTYYSVNGTVYVEGTVITVAENGVNQIAFYSEDAAGNQEQPQTVEVKVDQVKPVTEANAPAGWSQEAVQVTLTATDAHSGAAKTYYSVNGTVYVEGTVITVAENGVNQISFYSVDAAGNQEQPQTVEVKIDSVAPVTAADAPTGWSQEAVQVTLTATDAHSGTAKTFYSINGADYAEGTVATVATNGVNQISFYSVDAAGNQEQPQTVEVKIDSVAPVTAADAPAGWSQEAVKVTLSAADAHSGVSKTYYSVNGTDYVEGTVIQVSADGIHSIRYYSVDAAGNQEEPKEALAKIDRTAPEININLIGETVQGSAITLNYTAQDDLSGIASETMTVWSPDATQEIKVTQGAKLTLDKPGVYTVAVSAVNGAGLSTVVKKQITVFIPATIEVTPQVIKGNKGIFTVRVDLPAAFKGQSIELTTATLNGVKALANNSGYFNQAKIGQFKFERSDFTWTTPQVKVEFRGYVNGKLVVGQTTVKVQN